VNRRAWIDFLLTLALLSAAFVLAFSSSSLSRSGDWAIGAVAAIASLILALGGGLYIVPKLARRVRWEMWGFGIRTYVTTAGYLFLTIVVVVGVAAWNTANNLLYLILATLLAFVLVSGNIARVTLHDLAVQLRFPDHLFADEPAHLTVTLINKKALLPSCSVLVEADATRAGDAPESKRRRRRGVLGSVRLAHFIVVPPRASVRQIVEHTFEKRGKYRIATFTLSTKFPSGFFAKWRKVKSEGEIVVFPKTRPITDFFHTLPILTGSASSHIKGDGVDLYAMRDYRPTDHLRQINWKASARTRRLTVRETVLEEDMRLSIFFDPRRPGEEQPEAFAEQFERAVEMAASLARHFIQEGDGVELVTPSTRVAPGAGPGQLHKILHELAVILPARPGDESVGRVSWDLLETLPGLADDSSFKVLITSAPKGTIPAGVWRSAHVMYVEDL